MTPIVCQGCGAHVEGATRFCGACGRPLGPAQRSSSQMRALVEDPAALEREVGRVFGELRARVNAPEDLLDEGRELEGLVGRWTVLGPEERRAGFARLLSWTRAVGEWRTRI